LTQTLYIVGAANKRTACNEHGNGVHVTIHGTPKKFMFLALPPILPPLHFFADKWQYINSISCRNHHIFKPLITWLLTLDFLLIIVFGFLRSNNIFVSVFCFRQNEVSEGFHAQYIIAPYRPSNVDHRGYDQNDFYMFLAQ